MKDGCDDIEIVVKNKLELYKEWEKLTKINDIEWQVGFYMMGYNKYNWVARSTRSRRDVKYNRNELNKLLRSEK